MIKKLSVKDRSTAKNIHSLFQASYTVEAQILKATDFPPLKRTIADFQSSQNDFFAFYLEQDMGGAVEVHHNNSFTHVQSLVVHPAFFRQGIASALMNFVFENYNAKLFIVETGVDNTPATVLYKKLGFKEVRQWDTDFGIRKVRFERLGAC